MSDSNSQQLAAFLKEVSNWNWEEFCRAEHDPKFTTNESLIFALIRGCVMEKMDAIKIALNRLDGKLKTPVRIELPKVFYLYPNAKASEAQASNLISELVPVSTKSDDYELTPRREEQADQHDGHEKIIEEGDRADLLELTLRQTLTRMSDHPRQVPDAIIQFAIATQQWLNGNAPEPDEKPLVKSVVAAHLLALAQNRDINALAEVFDQIDGKLVETIQILGEDIYITDYSLTAPEGAYINKNGVLQMEATQAQDLWAQKLDKGDARGIR